VSDRFLIGYGGYEAGHAKANDFGFSINLNVTKLMSYISQADVQQAMKIVYKQGGMEKNEFLLLYLTQLDPEYQNKYMSHSLRVNTDYRQNQKRLS